VFNFNDMIHEERSKRLRALPKFSGTVLSAGCSGTWYFKWFEACTGHKGKHIGLELYSAKPTDLPTNVEWIANSVGDMRDVKSSSVDLLFSGQNIEHLTPQDLIGFLTESNRVLKTGALLVVDSPNRSVTQHLGYIQPEHTLELTADETVALLEAAGFEVLDVHGVWLVIDPITSNNLDIFTCKEGEPTFKERASLATKNPEKSFIWWINARKKIPANEKTIQELTGRLFWRNYGSFIDARFNTNAGTKSWNWGSSTVKIAHDDSGYALYGPYIPLSAGTYQAVFHIKSDVQLTPFTAEVTLDVASASGTVIHCKRSLNFKELDSSRNWREFSLSFTLASYTTGIEARVLCNGFSGSVLGSVNFLLD
jgi:ubiquinone/menaquinone biosynthesis C-methylase UbiE